MNPALIMMAASTAMSIYGSWSEQNAKEEAAHRQHDLAVKQASEMRRRTEYNNLLVAGQEAQVKGAITAAYGKSGIEASGTTVENQIQEVVHESLKTQQNARDELDYSIDALMQGADVNLDLVRKERTGMYINSVASMFQFGYSAWDKYDRNVESKTNKDLLTKLNNNRG